MLRPSYPIGCAGGARLVSKSAAALRIWATAHCGLMNPDGAAELLAAILTETPSLPGAACRRRAGLFDDRHDGESTEQQRRRFDAAAAVCSSCPAQAACRSAVTTSRWGGVGVQAGQVLVALPWGRAAS